MMETALQKSDLTPGSEESKRTLWKALKRVQDNWAFSNARMSRFLHMKPNTYGNWMKNQTVPLSKPPYSPETELVIALLSIYRSLGAMFASHPDQLVWLQTVHPHFYHSSPLEFAQKSCENLFYLRAYLDYIRGRGA